MIETRLLRYFVAVAELGHLTRAAERLGIRQPPLSQQIRLLERQLGVTLFQRQPRGMALTESGTAFLAEARGILQRMDEAVAHVRGIAAGERGRIAIGFTGSAAFHPFVPSVLRRFRQSSPGVTLVLEESSSSELIQALEAERLDAAFIRAPNLSLPGLVAEAVLEERMLAALPATHPLAPHGHGGRRPLPLDALRHETFILYRRHSGAGLYDGILSACRAAGFSPSIGQEAPRMLSTLSLVAAGLGISVVPVSLRRLNLEGVAYRALEPMPELMAPIHLAYRAGPLPEAMQRFLAEIRSPSPGGAGGAGGGKAAS
ncbi:MAG: LysR family transcriptional regulator [Azospirillum brasilense]|nr:MAG: LysR family transcriptional regulator [Azospirillum brasilense]